MLPLFILASVSRCVTALLCPTAREILAAVKSRDNDEVFAMMAQEARDHPDVMTLIHSERVKGITGVICGEELSIDSLAINCKFTVRYWSRNSYQVAQLKTIAGEWHIDNALVVTRLRR